MSNKQQTHCPDCHAEIELAADAQKGEVISCPDCSLDLEITGTNPFKIEKAPEAQEDWGE
ncbi:MAG TPA: lysine biosynthesis protein LysW [Candidatus Acidoferrales bacterium]|nr:lysine biosynthesis protein LysW [Candidatus Acidoferrales bacterium]